LQEIWMNTMGNRPAIGMPAQMDPGSDQQYLSRNYPEAIAAAGGVPLILPLVVPAETLETVVARLDGILLTGSNSDLDPALYNSDRAYECGPTQPLRDQMDFLLLEAAFRRKMPVLAICYGIQSLNVFLGGTLIQDIAVAIRTSIRHSNPESRGCPSHPIGISAGSVLEQMAGGLRADVNSTHHQALGRLGRGLEPIAHAPDGIVESVSFSDREHWILGVQWHPEKSCAYDEFSRTVFTHFTARCRAARGTDEGTHS
jgi:putative glutamine amidotransferase